MEAESVKPAVSAMIMSAASASQRAAGEFTADDLAAADQLVQLSVSDGGEEDACSSSSLSARSVNNAEAVAAAPAREDEEEEDDEDGDDANAGVVDRRARKRYRLVSELYAATRRVKSSAAGGKRKSRDRTDK